MGFVNLNKTTVPMALALVATHIGHPVQASDLQELQDRCECHYNSGDMSALRAELDEIGPEHPCAEYILRLLLTGEPAECLPPY